MLLARLQIRARVADTTVRDLLARTTLLISGPFQL